jgi:hypothetical protein
MKFLSINNIACPSCGLPCTSRIKLVFILFNFFSHPECSNCGSHFSPGEKWRGNFFGILFLSFILSGGLSVKYRSFLPYVIFFTSLIVLFLVAFLYLKPQQVNQKKKSNMPFFLLLLFIVFFLIFEKIIFPIFFM